MLPINDISLIARIVYREHLWSDEKKKQSMLNYHAFIMLIINDNCNMFCWLHDSLRGSHITCIVDKQASASEDSCSMLS